MIHQRLSLKEKIGYGFGDAASSMYWKLFGMYLMFFYTDIFGIPAAAVGTMFLFTRVGNAAFDPLVGILGDRTETRWGKFRPYLLWMAIPFGIIGVLTFTTPNLNMSGKIIYAYATYAVMMIIYSMINVPYASLMGVMTADGKERTTLATYRFIFAFGGSFLVLGLFQPLFDGFGTNNYIQSTNPAVFELKDTPKNINGENICVWENKLEERSRKQPADSLLFLSAKLTAKTKDPFKIGVVNKRTNEFSWFEFKEGTDTLGLLRDGSPSDIKIRLNSFVSKENLANLSNLKIVTANKPGKDVKINKVVIQEIDYKTGTQEAVIVITILAVIFFLFTFLWTRERIKPITEKTSLKADVKDLLKNAPWFILVGAGISTIFFNTIRDGAAIYYFKYYFQGQSDIYFNPINVTLAISTIYLLLGQAANIVGVVLAKPVSDKIGKKNTFAIAMIFASVFSIMFYFIGKSNISVILIYQALIGLSAGIIFPLVWSMYADAADYSEWKNNRRATGLVFSAASMSQKFGASIGIALAGWLLAFYGYHANVAQTIETQNGIRLMLSIYPAIGALLAAGFMFIYPLKEPLMDKIETDLANRRSKAVDSTS